MNNEEFSNKQESLSGWDRKTNAHLSDMYPKAKYGPAFEALRHTFDQDKACALFCKGKQCKFDNADWPNEKMAVNGIYSTWITPNILAMARPNTANIAKFDMITEFKRKEIKSIINLELPGEHASCGPGLEPSGFSYNPQQFMDNDIFFYNFGWPDWSFGTLSGVLDAVEVMQFSLSEGKVAVHCHAGHGRTGVLIACYLVYSNRMTPWEAIHYVRSKRPACLQTESQVLFVDKFSQYLKHLHVIFSTPESDDPPYHEFTLSQFLFRQQKILHGLELRKYKYVPKIISKCCEQLLLLAENCHDSPSNTAVNIPTDSKTGGERIASAMAETIYDENTKHNVEELKNVFNNEVTGYEKLKKVTNPLVVSKLMWDWIDALKEPVLPAQDLPQMLEYTGRPKKGLALLNKGAHYMIELLFTTIAKLEPLEDDTERNVVQRALSTLSHQNMVTEVALLFRSDGDIIQRTSNDGELMKESTASRMMYFFMHLLHLLHLDASYKGKKSSRNTSGSKSSIGNNSVDDSPGLEATKTGYNTSRSESAVTIKRDISKRRQSSFVAKELIDQELL